MCGVLSEINAFMVRVKIKFAISVFVWVNQVIGLCSAQQNQDTFLKEFCSYSMGDRSPLVV